jgi:hypothetical protein
MSAQPNLSTVAHRHTSVALDANPYAEVPTSILADSLEAQQDRGEPLNADMVFALVDRLVVAEGLAMPAPE